jgi:hypothetical protein
MTRQTYRAPRECPVCAERLHVTQLGCDACGTGISGEFDQCDFCALDAGALDVLKVFLTSRGNMKELERHLGVSYPTARARFDDLVRKLGLVPGPEPVAPAEPSASSSPSSSTSSPASSSASGPGDDPRLGTLRALANGELDVEQARRLISSESG